MPSPGGIRSPRAVLRERTDSTGPEKSGDALDVFSSAERDVAVFHVEPSGLTTRRHEERPRDLQNLFTRMLLPIS